MPIQRLGLGLAGFAGETSPVQQLVRVEVIESENHRTARPVALGFPSCAADGFLLEAPPRGPAVPGADICFVLPILGEGSLYGSRNSLSTLDQLKCWTIVVNTE